jgi:hypothetical protein
MRKIVLAFLFLLLSAISGWASCASPDGTIFTQVSGQSASGSTGSFSPSASSAPNYFKIVVGSYGKLTLDFSASSVLTAKKSVFVGIMDSCSEDINFWPFSTSVAKNTTLQKVISTTDTFTTYLKAGTYYIKAYKSGVSTVNIVASFSPINTGCSPYIGQVAINELRIAKGDTVNASNQVELYLAGVFPAYFSNWKLVIDQVESSKTARTIISVPTNIANYPFTTDKIKMGYASGTTVSLLDENGAIVDYLVAGGADVLNTGGAVCGSLTNSISPSGTSYDYFRTADGNGTWSEQIDSNQTIGYTNMTFNGFNIVVGGGFIGDSQPTVGQSTAMQITAVNNGSIDPSGNVMITVAIPSGFSASGFSPSSGSVTPLSGSGPFVWTIVKTNIQAADNLTRTLGFTLTVPATPQAGINITATMSPLANVTKSSVVYTENTGDNTVILPITVLAQNPIGFSTASQTVYEGDGVATVVVQTGLRGLDDDIEVLYSLSGTAISGVDYLNMPAGSLLMSKGDLFGYILFDIRALNAIADADKTIVFTINSINNATNAKVTQTGALSTTTITIADKGALNFDAWELAGGLSNRALYTKVLGLSTMLTVASMNQTGTALQGYSASRVGVRVVDTSSCPSGGSGAWTDIDLSSGLATFSFTPPAATQSAKLQFATKNSGYANEICSTDSFSVRPTGFTIDTSSLPTKQKSGETYTIPITAGVGYTANYSILTPSISSWLDQNGATISAASLKYSSTPALNASGSFVNGFASDMSIVYADIGRFNLDIIDQTWTQSDASNNDCAAGSSSNSAVNGKYGCVISGSKELWFVPYKFNVTSQIANHGSGAYTYISNDLNQSAKIGYGITAVNKTGVATQNYSSGLYERPVTLGININSNITSLTKNVSVPTLSGFASGVMTVLTSDTRAMLLNFNRDYKTAVVPFTLNPSDLNITVTDIDFVYGDANGTAAGSAVFIYGRLNSVATDMFCTSTPCGVAPKVFVEAYSPAATLNSFGLIGTFKESINARGWYVNSLDGTSTASVLSVSPSQSIDSSSKTASGGEITLPTVSASTTTKATLYLRTLSWLWYGANAYSEADSCSSQPCLPLNFAFDISGSNVNWVGDSKSTVTKTPSGKRDKKRTNW